MMTKSFILCIFSNYMFFHLWPVNHNILFAVFHVPSVYRIIGFNGCIYAMVLPFQNDKGLDH
jgi:uncharacterized protein YqjF (DUF2071 family)